MRNVTRVAIALSVATSIAGVAGCSLFSPSAECGGETETKLLRQVLMQTGIPGGTLLYASFGNNEIGLALGSLAGAAEGTDFLAYLKRLKALTAEGTPALEVGSIITKEKKSRRSLVCSAIVRFAPTPPAHYPTDAESTKAWKLASDTSWPLEYTAQLTDKGDEVLVQIVKRDCAGPGCDYADKLAEASVRLQGIQIDALVKSAEEAAITYLKSFSSAQSTFAAACGQGFYSPTLELLGRSVGGYGFISPDLVPAQGEATVRKGGFNFELVPGPHTGDTPETCNGAPAGTTVSSYKVIACPLEEGMGIRCFMTDDSGATFVGTSKAGPWKQPQ